MKPAPSQSPSLRIAVLWRNDTFQGQRVLSAFYRWASLSPEVTLRQFNAFSPHFQRVVSKPLVEWQPQGIVVRMSDWDQLGDLRRRLPAVPFVATHVTPPGLVHTSVVVNLAEAITAARDHFQSRGLQQIALFCGSSPRTAPTRVEPFRSVVPDGHELTHELFDPNGVVGEPPRTRKVVGDWLRFLPKPVGIMTLENHCARFLVRVCQKIGLSIPRDVQIIGVDDVDDCLECEPHLTSLEFPSERIGEVAMETMLRYLRHDQPPPPPVIPVAGTTLIARGSTGLATVGAEKIAAALQTIATKATTGMSAARVVKRSKVGVVTFYKHYRAATGTTPAKHLRETRLKEACRMLAETNATVTEIAAACGFSSPDYFAHFFRRETGHTPTAHRQRYCR